MATPKSMLSEPNAQALAKPLRIALYLLTALSAGAALFVEPALAGAVARRALSRRWLFLPIGVYGVFLLVYTADRARLVRRRSYPAGKAFFQVAFGLIFGSLLLPSTILDYQSDRPDLGIERLLTHADPEVREVAVYAIAFHGRTVESAHRVALLLDDKNSAVRRAAAQVLGTWSGLSENDTAGIRAWASALSKTSTTTSGDASR